MASHFVTKCSCGTVLSQCRCPDFNKPVTVVPDACDKCHTPPVEIQKMNATWRIVNHTGSIALNGDALRYLKDEIQKAIAKNPPSI